jgi:cyclophilin family peptidyl-prolyl cis-trans isomerase
MWLGTRSVITVLTVGLLASGCDTPTGDLPPASIPALDGTPGGGGTSAAHRQVDNEPLTLIANNQEFQSPARAQDEFFPEVELATSLGTIRVRLNAERAPRTVDNFLYNYVDTGFYDQTVFHFVEQGYLIAGGGYSVALQEKPAGTPIPCEANNGLSNRRGTLAMVRQPDFAHSATSQFFINVVDNPALDHVPQPDNTINGYCVFGEVVAGLDVVDRIAAVPVHQQGDFPNTPTTPVVITSISRVR